MDKMFFDFIQKTENVNNGEKISKTAETITVTISLAEYRSLVANNQRLECEVDRLNNEVNRAYAEKVKIEEQWERERKWRKRNAE